MADWSREAERRLQESSNAHWGWMRGTATGGRNGGMQMESSDQEQSSSKGSGKLNKHNHPGGRIFKSGHLGQRRTLPHRGVEERQDTFVAGGHGGAASGPEAAAATSPLISTSLRPGPHPPPTSAPSPTSRAWILGFRRLHAAAVFSPPQRHSRQPACPSSHRVHVGYRMPQPALSTSALGAGPPPTRLPSSTLQGQRVNTYLARPRRKRQPSAPPSGHQSTARSHQRLPTYAKPRRRP